MSSSVVERRQLVVDPLPGRRRIGGVGHVVEVPHRARPGRPAWRRRRRPAPGRTSTTTGRGLGIATGIAVSSPSPQTPVWPGDGAGRSACRPVRPRPFDPGGHRRGTAVLGLRSSAGVRRSACGGRRAEPAGRAHGRVQELAERDPEPDHEAQRRRGRPGGSTPRTGLNRSPSMPDSARPIRPPEYAQDLGGADNARVGDREPEDGDPPARARPLARDPIPATSPTASRKNGRSQRSVPNHGANTSVHQLGQRALARQDERDQRHGAEDQQDETQDRPDDVRGQPGRPRRSASPRPRAGRRLAGRRSATGGHG